MEKKAIRNFLRRRFPKENDIINKGKSAGIPGGIFIQLKKAGLFSNGGEMLKNPKKAALDKDGKLSSSEKRRGMAIEKNMKVKKASVGGGADMGKDAPFQTKESFRKYMKDKFKIKKITKENIEQIKEALKKRPKNLKTPKRVQFMSKAKTGKMMKANVGMAAKKVREKEMMKASMGKSVRGYGAARTSGMGLQDESLPPGKSLDYYKDLM